MYILHDLGACDTISTPYGFGRVTFLMEFATQKTSTVLSVAPSSSKEDIEQHGGGRTSYLVSLVLDNACFHSRVCQLMIIPIESMCRGGMAILSPVMFRVGQHHLVVSCLSGCLSQLHVCDPSG